MSLRTTSNADHTARPLRSRLRPPAAVRRPALYLSVAAAGAVLVGVAGSAEPAAQAEPVAAVSIADQLGISASTPTATVDEQLAPLRELAASRSERAAQQARAAEAQQAKDAAAKEAERKAAEEAERKAAEEAARQEAARKAAAEQAAREQAARERAAAARETAPAPAAAPAAAPSGSYQEYALGKLGGDSGQFSCLESLWGKESGWNPNAQNPSSSAYGIAQFLDSTWASTGIAKTSDPYRQIDAGLIYINNRYGSPCGAWAHFRANNWY